MNITVYLGASNTNNRRISNAARDLGKWIGKNGHTLVYGGSKEGTMGIIADAALQESGKVIGIEPEMFIKNEVQHEGISELIVTEDMNERKDKMMELGDVFVVLPGGTGTLEEASEILCRIHLNIIKKKIIFLNIENYWEPLYSMFESMIHYGFLEEDFMERIAFADDIDILCWELSQQMNEQTVE